MNAMLAESRPTEATAVIEAPRRDRKRVVIVGCGFAEIAAPIRQLEAKQRNASVLLAEVTGVDIASRTIEAASPGAGVHKIAFDYLVVGTGMRPSYFGHNEFG